MTPCAARPGGEGRWSASTGDSLRWVGMGKGITGFAGCSPRSERRIASNGRECQTSTLIPDCQREQAGSKRPRLRPFFILSSQLLMEIVRAERMPVQPGAVKG
jgi:hypothetical protein